MVTSVDIKVTPSKKKKKGKTIDWSWGNGKKYGNEDGYKSDTYK